MNKSLLKAAYLKTRSALLWPFLLVRKTKTLSNEEIRRILFLRHDRIGDMVLSTAALKALKMTYPQAKITVLASERNHEILTDTLMLTRSLSMKESFGLREQYVHEAMIW